MFCEFDINGTKLNCFSTLFQNTSPLGFHPGRQKRKLDQPTEQAGSIPQGWGKKSVSRPDCTIAVKKT